MAENKEELIEEEVPQTTDEEVSETVEEKLQKEIDELNDKYLRLMSEYAVAEILPIGDNLERALKTEVTSEDALRFKEGIEMVMKQFNDSLEKLNITPIPAEGEQFDPNMHNAIMHIEDESIDDNTVVEEFMKGYIYNKERVVRHSMVKVAN